ncbi:E3 ubiquitin-protein ligase RNF31, partial [Larimichthys crocea]
MPSLSEQLQEVRSRAEVCLYSGGRVVEVRAGVMAIANLPLPPCSKYHHIAAETMVIENSFGSNRKETLASLQRLSTALNILEKYGCNLTNPNRPKYWRTVKHNNPVFRATVDAIQGGRAVLCLYGYSNQQPDGLSFPDDVMDPDVGRVAAVTLEVMSLRMELEMLIKRTALSVKYSGSLPTASPASRGSAQNVTGCTTPTLREPTTVERLSDCHHLRRHHHPKTGPVTVLPLGVAFTALKSTLSRMCCARSVSALAWKQSAQKHMNLSLPPAPDGEKKGVSPEEVYTSMRVSRDSSITPCKWLKSELPLLLDQIRMSVATSSLQTTGHTTRSCEVPAEDVGKVVDPAETESVVQLSRTEAKQAWLTAGGDTERAARQALRDRVAKVKELCALGFSDEACCHEVFRQSGGEVRGALALLQRPLLEAFHKRIWSDKPEPPVDVHHPDKQHICRRLLAVYDLPSWGRCELALSLLLEHNAPYSLEDVVQAVRESHDREFIKRVLAKECPICLSVFPHSKMQSLTSCQCSVCCGCFQQHFTIAVRDKHIRDMVCPVCWEPDINDPEHLNSYFSTLDIQLRECLESEVYELFHKKLTEQALIKDPKFLWCCHCSYGFIYDGDQLKVTCFQCRNSFCAQCKKPWESQHAGLSCEQYQSWKRENDPEYQRQGLAGYLRDNGITCPNCRFQYALSKGGCMHFCCSQCRYQFCSGCNNPFHTTCAVDECSVSGLHAHHPRDCLFYLRDWEPSRLQALLQNNGMAFNTEPPPGTQAGLCGVIEQKDE